MKQNNIFKQLRIYLQLDQHSFANLLNMKQSTVSNYETGKRKPSLRVCYKLINLAKLKGIVISIEDLRPDE